MVSQESTLPKYQNVYFQNNLLENYLSVVTAYKTFLAVASTERSFPKWKWSTWDLAVAKSDWCCFQSYLLKKKLHAMNFLCMENEK